MPTAVRFPPDGRVFVAEKSGLIKVFDSLSDRNADVFADLRTQVHNYWDRGLLGLAIDPGFPTRPFLYVLYTHDAPIGGTAPRWGRAGETSDGCPTPPGATEHGCVVSGRLSRLVAKGNRWTGDEHVLVEGWFQQFPSHSIGSLAFASDGALYASGGEGASWRFADHGQRGGPAGDPSLAVGGTDPSPPGEGGALRAQDLRTPGDPAGLSGSIIRVDPNTGAAMRDNPLFSSTDPNARRLVAYGLRNPFRFVVRPGTRELWIGDVGWRDWEEINRLPDPTVSGVKNYGWPCYEGQFKQPGYEAAHGSICQQLYALPGAVTFPFFEYKEGLPVVDGETCGSTDASLSGLAFYQGGSYPVEYNGALFFADYTRQCIWAMMPGADGTPDPARRRTFVAGAATPVDLQIGPEGDLYYVDIVGGAIHRVRYVAGNRAPTAVITTTSQSGRVPLRVGFDASASTDPDRAGPLKYEWDLDGDGVYGEATTIGATWSYETAGTFNVHLRITDVGGLSSVATVPIAAGNTAPRAVIDTPTNRHWRVGEQVKFSGHGIDNEDGTVPASAMDWSLTMQHCSTPTSCHEHALQDYARVASGSFSAPDHEYPSYLELRLIVRDAGGLEGRTRLRLDPRTVLLTFTSQPSGMQIAFGSETFITPAIRTVLVGSTISISAPSPQAHAGRTYAFASWSDGGAQAHMLVAGEAAQTFEAIFAPEPTHTLAFRGGIHQRDARDPRGRSRTIGTQPRVPATGPSTRRSSATSPSRP